jgi:predicted ATPase
VEALGVTRVLGRLDDRFTLLISADRLALERQRSLAATVEWSYRLLDDDERRVFRAVSMFPGPFTLEAAEAVAGAGAEAAVLRLVDCSLVSPPRTGPDNRPRYMLLETLRVYGAELLAQAGEDTAAATAAAGYALRVAEQAAAGLYTTTGEAAAAQLAGCRGCHRPPGAGLGRGPRCRHGVAAGGRAGAVVAPAGTAAGSVSAVARGGWPARRGQ